MPLGLYCVIAVLHLSVLVLLRISPPVPKKGHLTRNFFFLAPIWPLIYPLLILWFVVRKYGKRIEKGENSDVQG